MPRVLRERLPFALLRHIRDGVKQREIGSDQLVLLARWLDTNPEVPSGDWFKRVPADDCLWRRGVGKDIPAPRDKRPMDRK
jgi:hypothetical protein